jgi:hypothetical protein
VLFKTTTDVYHERWEVHNTTTTLPSLARVRVDVFFFFADVKGFNEDALDALYKAEKMCSLLKGKRSRNDGVKTATKEG